jgi:hypothetical protein
MSLVNFRFITISGCAGAIGGCVGGGLGGFAAPTIRMLGAPAFDDALRAALLGALVWGLVGSIGGACIRLAAGWRKRRAPILWVAIMAGLASLVGAVETAQTSAVRGALTFALGIGTMTAIGLGTRFLVKRLWRLRLLLAAWLAIALAGEAYSRLRPREWTATTAMPDEVVVQLRCSSVPPLGLLGLHYWFAVFKPETERWHRWEVWQRADAGGTSWGHVHKDLMNADADVGGGPMQIRAEWHGEEARALAQAIARSSEYSERGRYLAWPGPNSNTYIAWVLRRAGVPVDLEPRGIGKDYLGLAGLAITTTGTGVQAESSLLGLKVGLHDGVELHFLSLTFGLDALRPAAKTPFGRLGWAEGRPLDHSQSSPPSRSSSVTSTPNR